MPHFDHNAFDAFALDHGVVGFSQEGFVLASGRPSHWYANWRNLTHEVSTMGILADFVLDYCFDRALHPAFFYGVPEGASPLALIVQYKYVCERLGGIPGHPLVMGRKSQKAHGAPQDRFFIGGAQGSSVILEDVTTTGGSLLKEVEKFASLSNMPVLATVSLLDRMELRSDGNTVEQAIAEYGISHFSLTTAERILPQAYKRLQPGEAIGRAIEGEYREHGARPIRLLPR